MTQTQIINLYRPTLQSIALSMLGSIADAEDAVHDTFVKWLTIDKSKIENTKAYLIRTLTNKCLNILRHTSNQISKKSIDDYQFQLEDNEKEKEIINFDVESQVSEAWKILHKKLEPIEKVVYILRGIFDIEYEDLQDVVDKNADNCRKIFSRARQKINAAEMPSLNFELPSIKMPESFKKACRVGQLSDLIHDLTSEISIKKS